MKRAGLVAGVTLMAACGLALGQTTASAPSPLKPMAHLVAPPDAYALKYDTLIAETALRLAQARLAARQGAYTHYWCSSQSEGVPADAYPRIEVAGRDLPTMPYLRLRRTGDKFEFFASQDGKKYFLLSCCYSKLKAASCVGLMVTSDFDNQEPVRATFSEIKLNGQPFTDPKQADIGKCYKPPLVENKNDQWTISTYGFEPDKKKRDYAERGAFVYKPVEGGFLIDAKITDQLNKAGHAAAALMCRQDMDVLAPSVSTQTIGWWIGGALRETCYKEPFQIFDPAAHSLVLKLSTAPGQSKEIAAIPVFCSTWEGLTSAVNDAASAITTALQEELKLKNQVSPAAAATSPQLEALAKARQKILSLESLEVAEGAAMVDDVLDAAPTCAKAHLAAAFCGAIPAYQDVNGAFHERGRYLAGPLSHMLLAQELAKPSDDQDLLSQAWVMLICGYPRQAMASLPKKAQEEPEGRALGMFLSSDYRAFTPETILEASRIEQLAWVRAVQICEYRSFLESAPIRMAAQSGICALLPIYAVNDVGQGHRYSILAELLACGGDAYSLLSADAIPIAQRRAIGKKMASALGLEDQDDPKQLAHQVRKALLENGKEETFLSLVPGVCELYEAAGKLPVGLTSDGKSMTWHCLSWSELARLQRGLLVRTIFKRVQFVGSNWSVPAEALRLSKSAATALTSVPGATDLLLAQALAWGGGQEQSDQHYKAFCKTPFSKSAVVDNWLVSMWPGMAERQDVPKPILRGVWDWRLGAELCDRRPQQFRTYVQLALAVDTDWPNHYLQMARYTRTLDLMSGQEKRYQYFLPFLKGCAGEARYHQDSAKAQEICSLILQQQPNEIATYMFLARSYYFAGERAKAIEIAEQASKKCDGSVTLSNLQGMMAKWLVEEGRPQEALKWGKIAAESGSGFGMEGLAIALEANNQPREALEVLRASSSRYEIGISELVAFHIRQKARTEDVLTDIAAAVKSHGPLKDEVAYWAAIGCLTAGGDCELMEKMYKGPLSFVDEGASKRQLFLNAFARRDFDHAIDYAAFMKDIEPWPQDAILVFVAAKLSPTGRRIEWLSAKLKTVRKDVNLGRFAEYCLGEWPGQDLPTENQVEEAMKCLLLGMEAELKGDLTKAVEQYSRGAREDIDFEPSLALRPWKDLLSKRLTTLPTTTSAPRLSQ